MTKNKLIIILSVLVACLFVALLYLLSSNNQKITTISPPTPIPTPTPSLPEGWVTSFDKKLGIKISHPKSWWYEPGRLLSEDCRQTPVCMDIGIDLVDYDLNKFIFDRKVDDGAVDNTSIIPSQIKIGDITGTKLEYGTAIGLGRRDIFIPFQNKNYLIGHFISSPEYQLEIDLIISSIKFIDNDYYLEEGSTYRTSKNIFGWSDCGIEDNSISRDIKEKFTALAQTSQKEISGLKIIRTPTLGFTKTDIEKFVLCEAGNFHPLTVLPDQIIWVGSCGGVLDSETELCDQVLTEIENIYDQK